MNAGTDVLRVFLVKPSRYLPDGWVERFRRAVHFNTTLNHIWSQTPEVVDGVRIEVVPVDEWVEGSLDYLHQMRPVPEATHLLALVGVASNGLHRALDLAAYARSIGVEHVVLGGPHCMTCDTSDVQGRGVSIATAEAEVVWTQILRDAVAGELKPVYGEPRWAATLDDARPLIVPNRAIRRRYFLPAMGIYPSRGCPHDCHFCSVVKMAGHRIRSEPVETTLESLRRAKAEGIRLITFTSDNFNKTPGVEQLLEGMIRSDAVIPWAAQVDLQLGRKPELIALMARAGCVVLSLGIESLSTASLKGVNKGHNKPGRYADLIRLAHSHGIMTSVGSILGFPEDTAETIADQVRAFKQMKPDVIHFGILTPLPGTRLYDGMLESGQLTDPNLDNYDAEHLTFRHPALTPEDLERLRRWCLGQHHHPVHVLQRFAGKVRHLDWRQPGRAAMQAALPLGGVMYYVSYLLKGPNPPNGFGRVKLDRVDDYLPLRRETFGFSLAPLPRSLTLTEEDRQIERGRR